MMYNILDQQIAIPLLDYIKHKARATRGQHRLKFTRLRTSSDSQIQLLSSHHKRLGWASSRHHRARLGAVQGGHHMRVGIIESCFYFHTSLFCVHILAPTEHTNRPPSATAPLSRCWICFDKYSWIDIDLDRSSNKLTWSAIRWGHFQD